MSTQTYTAEIDNGAGGSQEIEADSLSDALAQAVEWAEDGDFDTSDGTIWVKVSVESEDGSASDSETLAIHPPEPRCTGGEHDWQSPHEIVGGIEENPGVWGHGGGVIITECCMRCGCQKTTDTWAQNPDTGEQGLTSISYQSGRYASALSDDD